MSESTTHDEKSPESNFQHIAFYLRMRNKRFKLLELVFYAVLMICIFYLQVKDFKYDLYRKNLTLSEGQFILYIKYLLIAFAPFLFAFFFSLIFGVFPLEKLRSIFSPADKILSKELKTLSERSKVVEEPSTSGKRTESFIRKLIDDSSSLASKIYNRAGAYLLTGILIAIGGLVFFTYQFKDLTIEKTLGGLDTTSLINMFARIGALIFLELIAFFFLRQYRLMMEEFRYYEGIKRLREEKLLYLGLISEEKGSEAIAAFGRIENSDKLKAGESSILIEGRKLTSEEMSLLNRIIDKINPVKF